MRPVAALVLEPPVRRWHCPACKRTSTTREVQPHAQLHPCPKARGLLTPYVPGEAPTAGGGLGSTGKVAILPREDYEQHDGLRAAGRGYSETLRRDEGGRPAMGVVVEHAGGAHTALFVPGINIDLGLR